MGVDPAVEFIASIGVEPIVEPDAPTRFDLSRASGRWIEDLPGAIVELDFDPAMGMGGADEVVAVAIFGRGESADVAHANVERREENGHCRRKDFAVAEFLFE